MPVTCPPPPRAPLLPSRSPCAVISDRDADAPVRVSFRGTQPYSGGASLVAWHLSVRSLPRTATSGLPRTGYIWLARVTSGRHLVFSGPSIPVLLREISSERSA
jgi:hypothetical protein